MMSMMSADCFLVLGRRFLDLDDVFAGVAFRFGELEQARRVFVLEQRRVELVAGELGERALHLLPPARPTAARLSGKPTSFGVRSSSAKRIVTARSVPPSAKIAARYSLPRMTNVAMPARPAFSIVAASKWYAFVDSPAGAKHVRPLEQLPRNLLARDEAAQVDVARLARRERVELLVGDDREAAVVVLVAAHDVVVGQRSAIGRAEVAAHERLVVGAEHAQRACAALARRERDRRAR